MTQFCPWETAQYFVYSSNIPTLFFYSHLPAILSALLIGFLVFYKSDKSKIGTLLLIVALLFSVWSIFDLILWATNQPGVVMFFWSMQILFEPLVYLICFYLVYLFIKNQDLPFVWKLLGIFLYSPIVILLSTNYNLFGVNLTDCTAIEGFLAQYFTYTIEAILIIAIILFTILEYKKKSESSKKKEVAYFGLGIVLFLIAFSSGNIIGSFTENWTLAQAGLIGMPIFISFLAYLIVRFHTFNIKLIATQVLVWGLAVLIGAQLFFIKIVTNFILTSVTFVISVILGYFLIRSVKKEIEQKEQLAKLNVSLQESIQQRESLMHLINHKVKSAFTRSKYIFVGLLDGTFGEINAEVKKRAQQGLDSDNGGIQTVDLVLNADNLTNGTIKYEMNKINLGEVVQQSITDKKIPADAKNLQIETNIQAGNYEILGDTFWMKEAVNNVIDNSIRYTREGKIIISLEKKDGKILLSVKDTGIGITEEDKKNLFKQGGRGKESIKINVDSTGYGLYSVKLIIEAHKGRVWVESELGKGSTFYIELPATA